MADEVQRVVLLGFMASGKTTVGALLAGRLGWEHLDFDREIERRAGQPVSEIFRRDGEAAFRALEAEVTPLLLSRPRTVLTPGGGWVTNPALRELLPPGTLTVRLEVSPEEVVRRLRAGGAEEERPLLRVADPLARAAALLSEREPLYRADLTVPTDGRAAAEVARELEHVVRGRNRPPL